MLYFDLLDFDLSILWVSWLTKRVPLHKKTTTFQQGDANKLMGGTNKKPSWWRCHPKTDYLDYLFLHHKESFWDGRASICALESISDVDCAIAPRARRYPQHPTVSCPQKPGKPSANCLLTWGPSPSTDWLVMVTVIPYSTARRTPF